MRAPPWFLPYPAPLVLSCAPQATKISLGRFDSRALCVLPTVVFDSRSLKRTTAPEQVDGDGGGSARVAELEAENAKLRNKVEEGVVKCTMLQEMTQQLAAGGGGDGAGDAGGGGGGAQKISQETAEREAKIQELTAEVVKLTGNQTKIAQK